MAACYEAEAGRIQRFKGDFSFFFGGPARASRALEEEPERGEQDNDRHQRVDDESGYFQSNLVTVAPNFRSCTA